MELKVRSYFSPLADVDEQDARDIAVALNHLGYFQPNPKTGIIPFDPDYKFFNIIRKFQNDHGLFPDAALRPGGETETAINDALERLEESGGFYAWRTVRDDHVRPAHAAREGRLFRWSENLPGGHPGEDHNCRCWTEPLYVGYQPPPLSQRKPEVDARQPEDGINDFHGDIILAPIVGAVAKTTAGRAISAVTRIYRTLETKRLEAMEKLNNRPYRELKADREQLQSKFKHGQKTLGIKGNADNKTLEEFRGKLEEFMNAENTIEIEGTYNKTEEVIHYYDPETRLNVITDRSGNLRSGPWELTKKQIENLLRSGNLGGN